MSESTVRRVVWASAAYDFIVTLAFSTPWTAIWAVEILQWLHGSLGLSGQSPDLRAPLALPFANLLGTLVGIWSIVRMRAPTREHGMADTITRVLFAGWMTYAVVHGASTVVVLFLIGELGWALVQGGVVLSGRQSGSRVVLALSNEP